MKVFVLNTHYWVRKGTDGMGFVVAHMDVLVDFLHILVNRSKVVDR